jgi:hypothetical protein
MRKRSLVMAGLMVLTVMASTRVAQAQDTIAVKVPFDFAAGAAKMPAGEYLVKTIGPARSLQLINRTDPRVSAFVPVNSAESANAPTESKLVFNCYGDRYFLSQVWAAGNNIGRQLMKSAREKEMAQMARNEDLVQVVLVANLTK